MPQKTVKLTTKIIKQKPRQSELRRLLGQVFTALWKLTKYIAKSLWKLSRFAASHVWALARAMGKELVSLFRPRHKQKQSPPVYLPRAFIALGLIAAVVTAEGAINRREAAAVQQPSCALVEQVQQPFIQQYWPDVRRWCPFIMQAGAAHNLDAYLIATVIAWESAGNPSAYSQSGAVGLMQVMPRDGIAADFMCPKGPCFASRPTISELQDPAFNINYGSQLLAVNLSRTGSLREALKAYGPNNVGYDYADKLLSVYSLIKP